MSTLKADSITNDDSTVDFSPDILVGEGKVLREYYAQADAPASPGGGAVWWDTVRGTYSIYVNDTWYLMTLN